MASIPAGGGSVSLEHLIALNDEIAALSRAGMPLERGLLGVGGDIPGRLGAIVTSVGQRMAGGASLPQAVSAEGSGLPPMYRAVVEAGLRSGRLPEALEGLAGFVRDYVELRRAVGLALLYPLIVLLIGYGLFVAAVVEFIPRLEEAFDGLGVRLPGMIRAIGHLGDSVVFWGPIVPGLVVIGGLGWVASGRASALRPGRMGRGLGWVPGIHGILSGAVAAQFADWLALLIEHGVPLPEALELAGDATGDPRLSAEARSLADGARRGEPLERTVREAGGLPPLLAWLIVAGHAQGSLAVSLRHAAGTYRRRALRRASAMKIVLPSILLVVLGASVTLLYVVTLFGPWTSLLYRLTK